MISDIIRKRILDSGRSFNCNDNISDLLYPDEKIRIKEEVEKKVQELLDALIIDTENDNNTRDTAKRVSKMFVDEIFAGRYNEPPDITSFPNTEEYDGVYVTGPIAIRSTCAHHFMPIQGKAFIGVYPENKVIGLSKFNRWVDWIASRPQIQEDMTAKIAYDIEQITQADGVAVLIEANHFCVTHRGVKEHESNFQTSIMRGIFQRDKSLKDEFYQLVNLRR